MNFATRPKIVELFKQSSKSLVCWVQDDKVKASQFAFLSAGSEVQHVNMKAIGRATVDGKEMEFADVRIYVTPSKE